MSAGRQLERQVLQRVAVYVQHVRFRSPHRDASALSLFIVNAVRATIDAKCVLAGCEGLDGEVHTRQQREAQEQQQEDMKVKIGKVEKRRQCQVATQPTTFLFGFRSFLTSREKVDRKHLWKTSQRSPLKCERLGHIFRLRRSEASSPVAMPSTKEDTHRPPEASCGPSIKIARPRSCSIDEKNTLVHPGRERYGESRIGHQHDIIGIITNASLPASWNISHE